MHREYYFIKTHVFAMSLVTFWKEEIKYINLTRDGINIYILLNCISTVGKLMAIQ